MSVKSLEATSFSCKAQKIFGI